MQPGRHNDNYEPENSSLQAPPKLLAAFSKLPQERPFVPPTIDDAILREARRQLGQPDKKGFQWRRLVPRFALIAGLAAVLLLVYVFVRPGSLAHHLKFAREDVNHDGRVDILDAFALARQLKTGPVTGGLNDVNGDGAVDERDVANIAGRAVRLEKDHS